MSRDMDALKRSIQALKNVQLTEKQTRDQYFKDVLCSEYHHRNKALEERLFGSDVDWKSQ